MSTPDREEWRPVVGYEDAYEVSSLGRVRSKARVRVQWNGVAVARRKLKPRIMRQWLLFGYPKVGLRNGEGQRQRFVHVLVCEAFHGPAPTASHRVAHRDGSRTNNVPGNLRWATSAENKADELPHGTRIWGERHYGHQLSEEAVRDIRARSGHRTDCALAREYGVSSTTIRCIRLRMTWKYI